MPSATDGRNEQRDGMSLRDYFAAKALHAYTTHWFFGLIIIGPETTKRAAQIAYERADAMLSARLQTQEGKE